MSESQPGGPLSVRLDSLPLSSRTKNLFHWTGFVTIDDLLGSSLEELRRIKGFGKISLEETEAALAQHGIHLAVRRAPQRKPAVDALPTLKGCLAALELASQSFRIHNPNASVPNLYDLHAEAARETIAKLENA